MDDNSGAVCAECGKPIDGTEKAVWLGGKRVHKTCGEDAWYREWKRADRRLD